MPHSSSHILPRNYLMVPPSNKLLVYTRSHPHCLHPVAPLWCAVKFFATLTAQAHWQPRILIPAVYTVFFFFDPLVWDILISPHLCQYKYLLPFVPKVWGFISSNFSYDFDSALRIYYLYTKAPWYRVGRQHGLWDTEWERESEI